MAGVMVGELFGGLVGSSVPDGLVMCDRVNVVGDLGQVRRR